MKEIPIFSILIPVYNVKAYITECLNSVKMQTYGVWEATIVDDGSDDGIGQICDKFAESDGCFRVIHQPNRGVVASRNTLLKASKGNFIIFLDGDDLWLSENMLSEIADAMQTRKVDMVAWWLETYDMVDQRTLRKTNFIKETPNVRQAQNF